MKIKILAFILILLLSGCNMNPDVSKPKTASYVSEPKTDSSNVPPEVSAEQIMSSKS